VQYAVDQMRCVVDKTLDKLTEQTRLTISIHAAVTSFCCYKYNSSILIFILFAEHIFPFRIRCANNFRFYFRSWSATLNLHVNYTT